MAIPEETGLDLVRVCFFHSDKARERLLAEAFLEGVSKYPGDHVEMRPLMPEKELAEGCDVVAMVGVKSRELYRIHWRAGIHTLMLDKGYTRHSTSGGVRAWEYWRVAVDEHHPTHYLSKIPATSDRTAALGLTFKPWARRGKHIVLAGSSQKYHDFYDLGDPTAYAHKIITRIRKLTDREIVYRPKPSWKDAVPIQGTIFSQGGSIGDVLEGAHLLVTHGSNACFEAVMAGIPCIVLGEAVAKPISSTTLDDIEKPRKATNEERAAWLNSLAHCQWTQQEMISGEAWRNIRPLIYG